MEDTDGPRIGGDSTADGNVTPIESSTYRRLVAKVRYQASGPQFFSVNFFRDGTLTNGVFGSSRGVAVFPGSWEVITIDLPASSLPTLANWLDEPTWGALRIDPSVEAGVMVEIDWIVLLEDSTVDNEFTITWTSDELGAATQGVNIVDESSDVIPLVSGLPPTAGSYVADLGFLPEGSYHAQVFADPGPTATSVEPIVITLGSGRGRVLFRDGFE